MTIFSRLQYNFDNDKFGDAITLNDRNKEFLDSKPLEIKDWQISDIANGSYSTTNYYQNPFSSDCDDFKSKVDEFYQRINSIQHFDNSISSGDVTILKNKLISLSSEITNFKSHTSNVSGVTESRAMNNGLDFPDYQKSIGVGQQMLLLLNQSDSVQNATPMLGSMTSLFVKDEFDSNATIVYSDSTATNNSIRLVQYPYTDPEAGTLYAWNVVSNLTYSAFNTMVTHVQTANTLIGGRREHDWNFYRNSVSVLNDYNKIIRLSKVGDTQNYILTNLTGTTSYLEKLSSNT